MVLKKPIRSFKEAMYYWRPKWLNVPKNPRQFGYTTPAYAWLWWNFKGPTHVDWR